MKKNIYLISTLTSVLDETETEGLNGDKEKKTTTF